MDKNQETKQDETKEEQESSENVIKEDNENIKEDELIKELEKKDNEIEELNDRFLRLQADFMNYKNRVEKDKENVYTHATEDIMNQLLPILDNFERALDNMDNEDSFYKGVKMIYDQILDVLKKNGLKEIQCEGEPFDPNFHHAVFAEECEDREEGTILEILQKGYMLNDKVIRPSMVKVVK
ncbi:nucleotide exchange factor GrpE [Schnuerera sp. xch1]|uniref:nucleotide exchange factor GrpE n=1 Tax=Schnuerera sp. xch1 TaxID=2874283 RepID=UPI001CBFF0C1|nr:nucleotide exchange factor GrpE [Schnuerera sp. xch1]MBZ2175743.1 nucleotide exchange factor GrpE [Schnuerera sp. xch1]